MSEMWRPIVGYEGYYEVSSHGRIRSLARTVVRKNGVTQQVSEKLMSTPLTNGYPSTSLTKGGKRRTVLVHIVMAEAFLGPRPEGQVVRHDDDVKTNNVLSNLLYGTEGQNRHDAVRNGRNHNANKTECMRGHALDGANLSTSSPQRKCMACNRAQTQLLGGRITEDQFQQYADEAFELIMSGSTDRRFRTSAGYSRGKKAA